jgi:hypothetical protein
LRVRQNRLSQRLKSKLDSFGFDALIKGVSTLVEEEQPAPAEPPADELTASPAIEAQAGAVATAELVSVEAALLETEPLAKPPAVEPVRRKQPEPLASEPNQFHLRVPLPATAPTRFFEALEAPKPAPVPQPTPGAVLPLVEESAAPAPESPTPLPVAETVAEVPGRKPLAPEPLREALAALSGRLSQEAGRMAAALGQRDAEEAGFYLAHVNQILELLHTLDPKGDMARQLGVRNAPPPGRAWPLTAWTVIEFAESPFSGLLPSNAGESFARSVIYAAWGISFVPA